jgi:uncharacterized membrane protein YhaH (DUF805 family)
MVATSSPSPATERFVMVRTLLIRGLLVGLLAGIVAFAFASAFGERWVDKAIAHEDAVAAQEMDAGHEHGDTVVSRTVQSTAGLLTATSVAGVAIGGLFALAAAFGIGRFGPRSPRAFALALAGAAFVTLSLVPFFKYPANPPGVGDADTVGRRTLQYFALIAVALVAAGLAVVVRRGLHDRHDAWTATTVAGAAWLATIAFAYIVLPAAASAPDGFPADVLWGFRIASLGVQAVLWSTIGLVYGVVSERVWGASLGRQPAPSLTA